MARRARMALFAVANTAAHPPFFATYLATTPPRLLDTHAILQPKKPPPEIWKDVSLPKGGEH
jgi:hypothetical protein